MRRTMGGVLFAALLLVHGAAAADPGLTNLRAEPPRTPLNDPLGRVPEPVEGESREASRARLQTALDEVLVRSPLSRARVGVHVVSLDTGEELYAHEKDELLNPASNVKLFTAAAALARLGPDYRFPTEFFCPELRDDGVCPSLYVRGRGDPMLFTERLYGIAGELRNRGLTRVGDVVVDDTYFDDVALGPGWEQEPPHLDRPYMAPVGALSVNHNAAAVFVSPSPDGRGKARVTVEPPSDFFVVENRTETVSGSSRQRVDVRSVAHGDRQRIVIEGRIRASSPALVFYKKIDNPPMYAGETIKAVLAQRGVQVRGRVRKGQVPVGARRLHVAYSPSLTEVVRVLNKVSNNFVAEHLVKTLGAELMGAPGTWPKGVAAAEQYFAEVGLARGSYVMKNGSGLNDTNRFSARQVTQLLTHVARHEDFFPEFASSLGIAARDGTVRSRLEGTAAAGRLRAKTGTLENVTALSGYVRLPSGESYAYSILVNDFTTRRGLAVGAVDTLAATIASGGREQGPSQPPAQVAEDQAEVRARAATFAQLAQTADGRNLPFLRSALRTETDPVLRALVADAIYRADPESGSQVLVENVPTDAPSVGRLRALGEELNLGASALSSLIDVAANGHGEALDRLLLVAHSARDDEPTRALLQDGLQEIGRTAPDELFDALRRANEPVHAATLSLLGGGIAQSPETTGHPFLERLKSPLRATSVPAAMALYERLRQALTASDRVEAAAPVDHQPGGG